MNTNMAGFRWFSKKALHPSALDESVERYIYSVSVTPYFIGTK